jgi:hypothetical protein
LPFPTEPHQAGFSAGTDGAGFFMALSGLLLHRAGSSTTEQPVGPGGDQKRMKHLKEAALQRAKETFHQLRVIEMEGILT